MTHLCPVCGFDGLHEPARKPGCGGSYEICPACGFQFGFDDESEGYSYEAWRLRWIARGRPWDSAAIRAAPPGWDPDVALDRVHGRRAPAERLDVGQRVQLTEAWDSWSLPAGAPGTVVAVDHTGPVLDVLFDQLPDDAVAHLGPTDVEPVDPADPSS